MDKNEKILIVGCGYVGRRVGQACLRLGARVFGTTRHPDKAESLKKDGIEPILADLNSAKGFAHFGDMDHILVCPSPDGPHPHAYNELYNSGLQRLMHYLRFHPPRRGLLYTSSIGVYYETGGGWISESTEIRIKTDHQKALLAGEQHILQAPFRSVVYRLGGIYGPERNRIPAVKENTIGPDGLENFVNLIYIDDVVKSILFLLEKGGAGEIFLGVDGHPVKRIDLYRTVGKKIGVAWTPVSKPQALAPRRSNQNKRCTNKKLISLGYQFAVPTHQDGYDRIVKEEKRGL